VHLADGNLAVGAPVEVLRRVTLTEESRHCVDAAEFVAGLPKLGRSHRHFNAPVVIVGHLPTIPKSTSASGVLITTAHEPPLAPPPRSAPPFLECSSSLSQTAPPSTSLLRHGSLAPVLSEELSCDVPCWRSSWAHLWPAG